MTSNGTVYVAWNGTTGSRATGSPAMVYARSTDGGRSFAPEHRVNDQPAGVEALDDAPAVAVTPAGRGLVAYTDWRNPPSTAREPSSLYDTRLGRTDGQGHQATVDGEGGAHTSTFSPAIAALPGSRDALVAWQETRAGPGAIRIVRTSGASQRAPVRVARGSAGQFRPALTVSGDHAVVAWEDARNGPSRIYVARAPLRRVP